MHYLNNEWISYEFSKYGLQVYQKQNTRLSETLSCFDCEVVEVLWILIDCTLQEVCERHPTWRGISFAHQREQTAYPSLADEPALELRILIIKQCELNWIVNLDKPCEKKKVD